MPYTLFYHCRANFNFCLENIARMKLSYNFLVWYLRFKMQLVLFFKKQKGRFGKLVCLNNPKSKKQKLMTWIKLTQQTKSILMGYDQLHQTPWVLTWSRHIQCMVGLNMGVCVHQTHPYPRKLFEFWWNYKILY